MNCGSPKRVTGPGLLPQLRQELAEAERELQNPALFQITRQCIRQRIARLRQEIEDLTHATNFRECGEVAERRAVL